MHVHLNGMMSDYRHRSESGSMGVFMGLRLAQPCKSGVGTRREEFLRLLHGNKCQHASKAMRLYVYNQNRYSASLSSLSGREINPDVCSREGAPSRESNTTYLHALKADVFYSPLELAFGQMG